MKYCVKRLARPVLIFVTLLLLYTISEATTVVMLSDRDLIVSSRLIVTAQVRSLMSTSDDSGMIWTYVEIRRDRLLKGGLNEETLVLKQPGGMVGNTGIHVFG